MKKKTKSRIETTALRCSFHILGRKAHLSTMIYFSGPPLRNGLVQIIINNCFSQCFSCPCFVDAIFDPLINHFGTMTLRMQARAKTCMVAQQCSKFMKNEDGQKVVSHIKNKMMKRKKEKDIDFDTERNHSVACYGSSSEKCNSI